MSALFGKTQPIPQPKTVRAPVQTDPDILAAGVRARSASTKRRGRRSTLLTDALITGSGGQTLGA